MSAADDKIQRFNLAFDRLLKTIPGDEGVRSVKAKPGRQIYKDMPRGFCLVVGDAVRPCGLMITALILNDGSRGEARILELGIN